MRRKTVRKSEFIREKKARFASFPATEIFRGE
jgi:hypothetical protein